MKKCPLCAEEIQDQAVKCKHCGADLAADGTTKKTKKPPKQYSCLGAGCIVLIAIVGIVYFLGLLAPDSGPTRTSSGTSVSVGDDVVLVVDSGQVVVAVDEEAYKEWTRLAVAEDYVGMAAMTAAGRLLLVPPGTKAKVIESGFEKRRVRIMSGDHLGRDGWVTSSLVRKGR